MWYEIVNGWFREEIIFSMMAEAIAWADGEMPEWVSILCRSKRINPIAVYDAAAGLFPAFWTDRHATARHISPQ